MKSISQFFVSFLAVFSLLLGSGCSTVSTSDPEAQKARIKSTVEVLIVTGVRADLVANPQRRAAYVKAKDVAVSLAASQTWDVPKLLEAVSAAAPEVFADGKASLYLQGGLAGLQLIEITTGKTFQFNSPEYAQIFVEASAEGLSRALQ